VWIWHILKSTLKVCWQIVFLSVCLSHPHPNTHRSQRTAPSGSTLTVSLPNAKSASVDVWVNELSRWLLIHHLYVLLCLAILCLSCFLHSIRKTPIQARRGGVLRGRSRGVGTSLPKGIPLQFNYKATTNQVSLAIWQSLYTW